MTRMSKQGKVRHTSPRKPRLGGPKTGPKKDALEFGYKPHPNAVVVDSTPNRFIPKIG
ncbi:MAG: hypothetical protein WCF19_05935 [Chlamydiales bacterium]